MGRSGDRGSASRSSPRRSARSWSRCSSTSSSRTTSAPNDFITVLLPEFVPARWWHHLLHNQRALLIKGALLFRRNVVVTSVPYHLQD